jgi:hypothetical protein
MQIKWLGDVLGSSIRPYATTFRGIDLLGARRYRAAETAIGGQSVPANFCRGNGRSARGGAQWVMERGYGSSGDVQRIEENGVAAGALADAVSEKAKTRQRQEMGTLGSGNQPTISKCKEVIEMAGEQPPLRSVFARARSW